MAHVALVGASRQDVKGVLYFEEFLVLVIFLFMIFLDKIFKHLFILAIKVELGAVEWHNVGGVVVMDNRPVF